MDQNIVALLLFLFPLAYSPGPGNLFFAANGARFGLWRTLPANLGYHLATFAVTAAIGMGSFSLSKDVPVLFTLIKFAGVFYVLYLAWSLWRADVLDNQTQARIAGFWQGAVLFLLNPKAYVIIALMFSQFLVQGQSGRWAEVLLITTVFTLNNLFAFVLWTGLGGGLHQLFQREKCARVVNATFAALLALVAVWMISA